MIPDEEKKKLVEQVSRYIFPCIPSQECKIEHKVNIDKHKDKVQNKEKYRSHLSLRLVRGLRLAESVETFYLFINFEF